MGDGRRADSLTSLVTHFYRELHAAAEGMFQPLPRDHTLQPTALVNEAYARLRRSRRTAWRTPTHFFSLAARVMRQALVDHTRLRTAGKRGEHWRRVGLDEALPKPATDIVDTEQLQRSLESLAKLHPRQRRIVELRFLQGRSVEEVASAMGVSERTVKADWQMARAWLMKDLRSRGCHG
ncbi:MAG: ECF-type sigma factor [Planctomycetota bacterium]